MVKITQNHGQWHIEVNGPALLALMDLFIAILKAINTTDHLCDIQEAKDLIFVMVEKYLETPSKPIDEFLEEMSNVLDKMTDELSKGGENE